MSDAEKPNEGDLILYQSPEGTVRIEVRYESETFWLNQKKIAELFDVDVRTISEHLRNIFATGELVEKAVLRKFRTTAADGKTYSVNFYSLDAIISVGYRVNSTQATRFRIWATQTLREFIVKGFVLDMGLTTWKNAPLGKIVKNDVSIAKNYLIESEIKELERIVTMYLDYAENQAARQIPMRMADWVSKLDAFLNFNEYQVLTNAGTVSAEVARRLAEEQYATFRVQQDRLFESDFEKEIKRIEKKKDQEETP
jgi:hypothetical protein